MTVALINIYPNTGYFGSDPELIIYSFVPNAVYGTETIREETD